MEKSVAVRRKAHNLARSGYVGRAIEEMSRVLERGEADPYDYVFQGDLLVRGQKLEAGISAFQEALTAYERVGLFRNAIAVGKKILRADPTQARTYQRLGELYAKEGLMGDSIAHFLTFLDKSGGEVSGEEFAETLERVVKLTGPRVEVVQRLAELYVRIGRERRAAEILDRVASQAEDGGNAEIAASLRQRSAELFPAGIASEESESAGSGESFGPQTISIEAADAGDPPQASEPAPGSGGSRGAALSEDPPRITSLSDEISAAAVSGSAPARKSPRTVRVDAAVKSREQADEKAGGPSELPENVPAAEKLVAECRQLGDTLATVRSLIHLGDLKIAAEDLEGAAGCFLEVLQLDPVNPTARRRLARFRTMGLPGADRIAKECDSVIRDLIEMDGAKVSVMEAEGAGSDEWVDLTSLVEKFRNGVSGQVKAEDFAGHYDLGLSHHEMGLFQEALEEFDQVLRVSDLPPGVEVKAREMRAICLRRLDRCSEAVEEYRRAIGIPGRSEQQSSALRYQMACALESAGELEEARGILRDLAREQEAPPETVEHLERLGG